MTLAPAVNQGPDGRKTLWYLLIGLALGRGVVLLCTLPPFEAWDEYQHVAYVLHVAQTGRLPVYGETRVAPALVAALEQFPQSRCGGVPRAALGVFAYAAYWQEPAGTAATRAPHGDVPLYEAQHGPLYYRLAAPLFRLAGGAGNLKQSVAALRLANLLAALAAIAIALGAIRRHLPDQRHQALVGLALASHPLFLVNSVRVANDALAVLLATCTIALALELKGRRLVALCAALAVLAGCAIRAKAVNYGLLPFLLFCWTWVVVRDKVPLGRAALAFGVLWLGVLLIVSPELRSNLARFGTPTAMQEALVNLHNGRTTADLIAAAWRVDWLRSLAQLWLEGRLCIAGWSFLHPSEKLMRWYQAVIALSLLGWLCALLPRARFHSAVFPSKFTPCACLVLCAGYALALGYHTVQSQLAWGQPSTGAWYACAVDPWWLMLIVAGALHWPLGRLRLVLPLVLAVVFLHAEAVVYWGLMAATYTGGAHGWVALGRLAALQPPLLGTPTLLIATAGTLVLFARALALAAALWLPSRAPCPPGAIAGGMREPFHLMRVH